MARRVTPLVFLSLVLCASALSAGEMVPFRGHWEGSTISADFIAPDVVLVVASGTGNATELGAFQMTSPHLTYLATFIVTGQHNFTAANGDTLNAEFTGQLLPNAGGNLEGTLDATITGGTGRFAGATGSYAFHIVARPAAFGFDSTADFTGSISSVGTNP